MRRLVLFDIDETMIYSDGVGRRALQKAFDRVLERKIDASNHNMSGKTDPQICHELLSTYGYSEPEINDKLPLLFSEYTELLRQEIACASSFGLHAGVQDLLDRLKDSSWCYLGLLTGNIEIGARLKLKPFDLNGLFAFGAFGCDSPDRNALPSIAHKRAEKTFAENFQVEELVIIGDAVNDVLCAKGYGVRSIITCTGKTSKESLSALKPDFLFDSLANTEEVLAAIRS
ncbi:MAG: HAD hydrolase-like protein [Candidatus Obscuribacterales bacterium]|nr:HAD hydrolase-like protein [Candidatus Obscuribacterales bacterium]